MFRYSRISVMVIRPSEKVFQNMMAQRALLTTYDGSDTGFLNAYVNHDRFVESESRKLI